MKFTKRIAYCGGVSALLFSLNSNAMGQGQEAQGQDGCKDILECEADYSQTIPFIEKEEGYSVPYKRDACTSYSCSVEVLRRATDTTVVKGIIKIHRQTNSGSRKHNNQTYEVTKVEVDVDKCDMSQQVSQLQDLLNTEQFSHDGEPVTLQMLAAEGEAYQVDLVDFEDETINFTMTRVGNSTGPDGKICYRDRDALRVIRDYVGTAENIQSLQHVTGKFPELNLKGEKSSSKKRIKKHSK